MKKSLHTIAIILTIGLFVFSCKSPKLENKTVPSNVLVQMMNKESVGLLENEFKKYGLKEEKIVSRPMAIYLFNFNTETITNVALVELLKNSPLVKEAQPNNNVQIRNND